MEFHGNVKPVFSLLNQAHKSFKVFSLHLVPVHRNFQSRKSMQVRKAIKRLKIQDTLIFLIKKKNFTSTTQVRNILKECSFRDALFSTL